MEFKYILIFLWSQLYPTIIYIFTGYKNTGKNELKKNIKAGIRVVMISTLIYTIIYNIVNFLYIKNIINLENSNFLFLLLIFFNVILNIGDLFSYINFGTQINSDIYFTILETNLKESKEFIRTYFNKKLLIIYIYIINFIYFIY